MHLSQPIWTVLAQLSDEHTTEVKLQGGTAGG